MNLIINFEDGNTQTFNFTDKVKLDKVVDLIDEIFSFTRLSEEELFEMLGEDAEILKPYLTMIDNQYAIITAYRSEEDTTVKQRIENVKD